MLPNQYKLSADNVADLNKWGPILNEEMKKLPELKDVNIDQQNGGLRPRLTMTVARLLV